jgi:hypothetical protein
MAHHFFASAPNTFHQERLRGALETHDARAPAALSLMNEAFATAIGNGVLEELLRGDEFAEYFDTPRSLYDSSDVDAAAKAIFPLMREYVGHSRRMDRIFVEQYFALVIEHLGSELDALSARLRVSAYVETGSSLAKAVAGLPQLLGMSSLYGADLDTGDVLEDSVLWRHSYLSGIVLTNPAKREQVAPMFAGVRFPEMQGTGDVAACTAERASGAVLYLVVTDRDDLPPTDLVAILEEAASCVVSEV